MTGDGAARRVTVRLYPLLPEHALPMLGDLAVFTVAYGAWLAAGLGDGGWALFPLGAAAAAAHAAQVASKALRFDDEGITITRPWRRRRRIPWSQASGLVYQRRSVRGADLYLLRLVLAGQEPPYGKYLTDAERKKYARGPLLLITDARTADPGDRRYSAGRATRCQERVFAELARHGLDRPPPRELAFQLRGVDAEQAAVAVAADFLRLRDAARAEHAPAADGHSDLS